MTLNSQKFLYLDSIDKSKIQKLFSQSVAQYPQSGFLALVAEQNIDDINELQNQANQVNCPLVGAVFPELIVDGEFKKQGVLLLNFEVMPVYNIISFNDNNLIIDEEFTKMTDDLNSDNEQALFMIFDSMVPNIASIIDDLYLKTGDIVNYMGVNAGSETFQPINCIFDNDCFLGNAVLMMFIEKHHGAILEHGYSSADTSLSATSTTGNRISSIEWRPAFDVYKELALKHYNIEITKDNFYENAVHFPIGIMRMDGEMLVRIPVALDDDGSLLCVGEVPENSVLTLLKAVSSDSSSTVDSLVENLINTPEDTMLTFYCAGRRMHLGDDALKELSLFNTKLKNKKVVGALSLGEISGSKQGGYPLFHNAALVNIPWE